MKVSAIDSLIASLWGYCVSQRPAEDGLTIERWQRDELSHLKERFMVHPLPPELKSSVNSAILEWEAREDRVFKRLGLNKDSFIHRFEKLREDFLKDGNMWQMEVMAIYPHIAGVVRNLDWVNLFAWILPIADRRNRAEHIARGRVVAALFYVEILARYGGLTASDRALKSVEARWQIVNSI